MMASWYCPLPFKSLSSDPMGNWNLCCEAEKSGMSVYDTSPTDFLKSDYMNNVKKGFNSPDPSKTQEILDACKPCFDKENAGLQSKRQNELVRYAEKDRLDFFEVKLIGNICNFKCVSCGPNSSSSLAEEQGVQDDYKKYHVLPDIFWNDFDEISKKFTVMNFSGGEPFMSPTVKTILKRAITSGQSKNMRIMFNTNGYPKPERIDELLKHFKTVQLAVSIDAYGKRNEVIRRGSDWEELDDRVFEYAAIARRNHRFSLSINPVISILNVGYMDELNEWFQQYKQFANHNDLLQGLNFVQIPKQMNPCYMPRKIKDLYKRKPHHKALDEIYDNRRTDVSDEIFSAQLRDISSQSNWTIDWKTYYPEFMPYLDIPPAEINKINMTDIT